MYTIFLARMSTVNLKIVQLIFINCFHRKRPLWELKLVKRGKTSIFIANKRLRESKIKFLIEHDKKKFIYRIITLYIEETPDTNISDTSNELKQIVAHNCFYIYQKKQKRTLISHLLRGVLGLIPFPKAIK